MSDAAPRYRRTKYSSVYVRHEKGCPAAPVEGPRCRCEPSYRARHRRYGHSPTFKDIHEASGWLLDAKRGKLPEPAKADPAAELTFLALGEQWREAVRVGMVGTRRKRRAIRATRCVSTTWRCVSTSTRRSVTAQRQA